MNIEEMIEKFQCPGCVVGSDTKCGSYKEKGYQRCISHTCGTSMLTNAGIVPIYLGLPVGFCRLNNDSTVVLYTESDADKAFVYDLYNVPVWAMELDGFLYVRVYSPRIDSCSLQVVEGGKMSSLPSSVIDVTEHIGDMD